MALGNTPELDDADWWRPLSTASPTTTTTSTTALADAIATSHGLDDLGRLGPSITLTPPPAKPGLQTPSSSARFPRLSKQRLVDGLDRGAWGDAEFVAQHCAQVGIDTQRLGGIPLCRKGLHEDLVPRLSQRVEAHQLSAGSHGRGQFRAAGAKRRGCVGLERSAPDLRQTRALVGDPRRVLARQELPLGDEQRGQRGTPGALAIAENNARFGLVRGHLGNFDVDPRLVVQLESKAERPSMMDGAIALRSLESRALNAVSLPAGSEPGHSAEVSSSRLASRCRFQHQVGEKHATLATRQCALNPLPGELDHGRSAELDSRG